MAYKTVLVDEATGRFKRGAAPGGVPIVEDFTVSNPAVVTQDYNPHSGSTVQCRFGTGGNTRIAQSIAIAAGKTFQSFLVELKIGNSGDVTYNGNLIVKIVNDTTGSPGSTVYHTVTLNAKQLATGTLTRTIDLSASTLVTTATTYWITLEGDSTLQTALTTASRFIEATATNDAGPLSKSYNGTWNSNSGTMWHEIAVTDDPQVAQREFNCVTDFEAGTYIEVLVNGIEIQEGGGNSWTRNNTNNRITTQEVLPNNAWVRVKLI